MSKIIIFILRVLTVFFNTLFNQLKLIEISKL